MLSRAEIQYLIGARQFSDDYARKIRSRVETKVRRLEGELTLLARNPAISPILEEVLGGLVRTENCPRTDSCPSGIDVLRAGLSSFRDFEPAIIGSKGRHV